IILSLRCYALPRLLPASPTRLSSDLASAAPAGPHAWEWQALPDGLLFRTYLAGPKEPRFASAWLVRTGGSWFWDATLGARVGLRSEEHTSELQSRENLVCRLLLEKKK